MSSNKDKESIQLQTIKANGITHRVATSGNCGDNPLVLLLHGWPESWYSWRHQISALSSNGYYACAPDMRGYGGTDKPLETHEYNVHKVSLDVVEIAKHLGYDRFVLIGHDFGAYLAWHVALLFPQSVSVVIALSVPYVGRGKCGVLTSLRKKYGDSLHGDLREKLGARFNYMLHHNLPHAADEYYKDRKEALFRIYAYHPGVECVPGTADDMDDKMFLLDPAVPSALQGSEEGTKSSERDCKAVSLPICGNDLDARHAPGLWKRIPQPCSLPDWMTEKDFDFYVSEYTRNGFHGGLQWYNVLDLNWELTRELSGKRVQQPSLFISGDEDMVIYAHGGAKAVESKLREQCASLQNVVFLEGCGHWIQQEKAKEVNDEIISFLNKQDRCQLSCRTVKSRL